MQALDDIIAFSGRGMISDGAVPFPFSPADHLLGQWNLQCRFSIRNMQPGNINHGDRIQTGDRFGFHFRFFCFGSFPFKLRFDLRIKRSYIRRYYLFL